MGPASNFKIILFIPVLFEFDNPEVDNGVCYKNVRTTNHKQFRVAHCKAKCTYRKLPSLQMWEFGIWDGHGVSSEGRRSGCTFSAVFSFETEKRRFRSLWAPIHILTGFRVRRRHLGRAIKTKSNAADDCKGESQTPEYTTLRHLPIGKLIFDWMCWF